MTREELEVVASEAKAALDTANNEFTGLRKDGSAADIVKAATAVTKAERASVKAQSDVDTFELVAVYEAVRTSALKGLTIDFATLKAHDVKAVTIIVPVTEDGSVDIEKVSVNTLGKRTVIKSSGNGTRTRYTYGPEALNSRQVVEAHGADEVGEEKRDATLAEPSKYGLTHLADRIANRLEWDKVPANAS